MGIFEATVIKPLFQLINHINMGQDTRDTAKLLYLAVYTVNSIFSIYSCIYFYFGVDLSISS